jgi:hypothetical protein
MAEGLASSGIAGALKELIDDRVTMEAMELVAAADRDEAAKMTDKPSIKDSNTQGINQLVQTLAPGMQLRNNQIQKSQMQKMLGLGGQPAPNMRMADGGIVGFEEGGSTGRDFTRGNNFSRHEAMYGPILRKLGVGPMYDFGGGLNEDFMNRAKKRAAVEKYGPDAAMPVGSNQPIPMLMQKYGSKRVMEFFDRQKELKEESKSVAPEYRDAFNDKEALFISDFSDMLEDINQAQSGSLDISEEAGMGLSPMAPMAPIPTPLNAIRRPQKLSGMADGGIVALKEGGFPDLSGDGKVTQKDILMGRGVVDKAQGGIVGFNPGGSVEIDGKQVPVYQQQFRDFTGPSDQQKDFEEIVSWIQTYNIEPEISNAILRNPNSVAGNQIDTLKQVLVGAGGRTLDEINNIVANFPSLSAGQNVNPRGERDFSRLEDSPEPQGLMALGQNRARENEERRRATRSQPMTPEEIARQRVMAGLSSGVEKPPLSEFQQSLRDVGELNVEQQLLDAEQRLSDEQRALEDREIDFLNKVSGESDRMAALNYGINPENARMNPPNLNIAGNIKDFVEESGLGSLDYEGFARSILPKATDVSTKSTDPSLGRYLGAFTSDMFTGPSRAIDAIVGSDFITDVQEGYYGEEPGTRDDAEIATDVIQTSPIREEPTTTPDNVEKPSRTEIDAATVEAMKSEESPTEVGPETFRTETFQETLALDPSTTGYEEKLDEIMQRANSPTRILATFLQGVGEGKTIGQGLMAGGKAIAAAERAYDAQEIQLRGLLEQQRISQQNFNINMQKIANEKEQLRIMEDNYKRTAQVRSAYNDILSTYYDDMISAQRSRDTASLISTRAEIAADFRGNPILHEDVIRQVAQQQAGGGLNTRQLDKYIEQQGGNSAFMEAAESAFINQLFPGLSGLGGSVGAGTGGNIQIDQETNDLITQYTQ